MSLRPAPKPLTTTQLAAKLTAPTTPLCLTIGAVGLGQLLEQLIKCFVAPVDKQLTAYSKSRACKALQKLYDEKNIISGWEWHKKKSGVRVFWSTDPLRERELKKQIRRDQHFEFKDGVKVSSMYHLPKASDAVEVFLCVSDEHFEVRVLDRRFSYTTHAEGVWRYHAQIKLTGELADVLRSTGRGSYYQPGQTYRLTADNFLRKYTDLTLYDRKRKLLLLLEE